MKQTKDKQIKYSKEETKYIGILTDRLMSAKSQRDNKWEEFDDDNYLTVYEDDAKAANSYLRPKMNEEDTRIVTGTTKQKVQTLLSTVLNLNLESSLIAFDKYNKIIDDIGETMEDFVEKSREMEDYETQRVLIYKEAFDHGTAFTEEQYYSSSSLNKKLKDTDFSDGVDFSKLEWDEELEKNNPECRTRLLSGPNVYLGNIREFFIKNQPYVFTVDHIGWSEAEKIYSKWDRWKYVSKYDNDILGLEGSSNVPYSNWTLEELKKGMVEVIKYQDKWTNEYQIFLNGVMMLPVGFPLTVISPSGDFSIAKLDVNPISNFFAYSKSIPSDTKVSQEVMDEFLRLAILKTEQSFTPPMANNTNKILSKKNLLPGVFTRDINTDQVKPLIESNGVTASEFGMIGFIKEMVDEMSIDPTFSGEDTGKITATEYQGRMQQQMKKLGYSLLGVLNFEKQLTWLRIYNIIQNWTKPIDNKVDEVRNTLVDVYRSVEKDTEEDGKNVRKIIEFSPEKSMLDDYQVMAEEKMISQGRYAGKKDIRKIYIDPGMLKNLKAYWFITVTPTEKESDELNKVLFIQNIKDAMGLFGMELLNMEYIRDRFASVIGENPDKFFMQQPVNQLQAPQMGQNAPQGGMGGQVSKQVAQGVQKPQTPSLNTLQR